MPHSLCFLYADVAFILLLFVICDINFLQLLGNYQLVVWLFMDLFRLKIVYPILLILLQSNNQRTQNNFLGSLGIRFKLTCRHFQASFIFILSDREWTLFSFSIYHDVSRRTSRTKIHLFCVRVGILFPF